MTHSLKKERIDLRRNLSAGACSNLKTLVAVGQGNDVAVLPHRRTRISRDTPHIARLKKPPSK
jgi:hypothetical protein